jgi:hypothetical protein
MVRRMAMSRVLFLASITRPEMMFSAGDDDQHAQAAGRMAIRSTFSAPQNDESRWVQSVTRAAGPAAALIAAFILGALSGSFTRTSMASAGVLAAEEQLRLGERHVDVGLVVLAHADAEGGAHRVGLLQRRAAESRGPRRTARSG